MRVDKQNANIQIMGKKKHRLTRKNQHKSSIDGFSDSSDEATALKRCDHLNKAIQINALRKATKQLGTSTKCTVCLKNSGLKNEADDTEKFLESTTWVCLLCGNRGCDRNSPSKHALHHFLTPRSAAHALAVNLETWSVWCYLCDDEVDQFSSGKLTECIEFLKKFFQASEFGNEPLGTTKDETRVGYKNSFTKSSISSSSSTNETPLNHKVKGLCNLGNTCFFNAVMQNLAQSHLFISVMKSQYEGGTEVHIDPAALRENEMNNSSDSSSNEASTGSQDSLAATGREESITVRLPRCERLFSCVIEFFNHFHTTNNSSHSYDPSNLFRELRSKCPKFKGFQQQDSHEMLRYLLENLRIGETKRVRLAILKAFNLPENITQEKVDKETKLKLKMYGRSAWQTVIDQVFGGHFISTVYCESCETPSQTFESFLDISLPIMEEKPSRLNPVQLNLKDKSTENESQSVLSKHQLKKSKKQARREAKKNSSKPLDSFSIKTENEPSVAKKENIPGSLMNGSISDADVEDNLESDVSRGSLSRLNSSNKSLNSSTQSSSHSNCNQSDPLSQENIDSTVHALNSLSLDSLSTCGGTNDSPFDTEASTSSSTIKFIQSSPSLTTSNNSPINCNSPNRSSSTDECCNSRTIASNCLNRAHSYSSGSSTAGECCTVNSQSTVPPTNDKQSTQVPVLNEKLAAKHAARQSLVPRYQPMAQECSIESCLTQFTAAELLTGQNKFGCERCTKNQNSKKLILTNASKQVLIIEPPAILTLHLKRFQQVGYSSFRKVNRHVRFPITLDIAPFCSAYCQGIENGQKKIKYSLYGIVEHSGRLTGGHYTAYVRSRYQSDKLTKFLTDSKSHFINVQKIYNHMKCSSEFERHKSESDDGGAKFKTNSKWFYYSDTNVKEISEENVLRVQAYLLFYERIL